MVTYRDAAIKHNKGLHARAAAMVVQKAHELYASHGVGLYLHYPGWDKLPVNSLMPLVALRIKCGDLVGVSAEGAAAEEAVNEMVAFLESDFEIEDAETRNRVDTVLQDNAFTMDHIFSGLANGVLAIDENDLVTVFNPAAERILGLKASEVIGKNVRETIADTRLHIVRETMTPELGCRQVIGDSVIVTNRTPLVAGGQVKGAIAIFEDISSLEKVTGELREVKELKERLHLVLESVQDGICVVDKQGYITYVNSSYARIVQLPSENLIGQNVARIAPLGARAKALLTGKPVLGSVSRKPDGQMIIANVTPIIVDGEVSGVVSAVKNLSEVQALMDSLSKMTAQAEYLQEELHRTRKPVQAFDKIIGRSGAIREALAVAAKAAEGMATVLITGESGTGKELVAEGIHFASPRAAGPFIRVNCAAIPASLLESELFGHERGAFTGAVKRKLGRFELADRGTIFLDEIGDMEKDMQAKLLRVLQRKEFQRVGGENVVTVDVRIIAATNRDLEKMVAEGSFREDLYYRLNIIPIVLPPLRQRKEDIPLLVEHFFLKMTAGAGKAATGIRKDALEALMGYRWPGNVRELENILERVLTLADQPYIEAEALPAYIREGAAGGGAAVAAAEEPVLPWEVYEREIIKKALGRYGTFNRAAKALGLTHKTVAAKARKYGLTKWVAWENR
ncbi:MAG TPA: sigma 54-interacting transcriptional regulator [Selenomonadales bacterium]|nr:sigma 54-interacting transcriptional regulator [Selenomonadales bacterium]